MTANHGTEWGFNQGCRCAPCTKAGELADPLDDLLFGPVEAAQIRRLAGLVDELWSVKVPEPLRVIEGGRE